MCQMGNGTIYKYIHYIYIQEKKSFSDDSNNAIRIARIEYILIIDVK